MMITTTQIANSTKIGILLFSLSISLYAQKRETIYIRYDKEVVFPDSMKTISFVLYPTLDASSYKFIYGKHEKRKMKFCEIKNKLISQTEVVKKFNTYLIEVSKKVTNPRRSMYLRAMKSLPNLNAAFKKIYIYHIQTGTLYEVEWDYAFAD